MIIRAVSSDDDSDDASAGLVDAPASRGHDGALSTSTAVKLAWLGASLGLIALLLLDLAALLNQLFPSPGGVEPRQTDPFSLGSVIVHQWRYGSVVAAPATVLNNIIGQLFVCSWIYSREKTMATQRAKHARRRRNEVPHWLTRNLHWCAVLAVLCIGHMASCIYILFALFESHGGNVRVKFWLGRSSSASHIAPKV